MTLGRAGIIGFRGLDVVTVAAAFVAGLGAFVATSRGPGLSTDSTYYLSAGINLAAGDGLTTLTGTPLVVFAPGLSLLVALGELLGSTPTATMRALAVCTASGTVVLGAVLLRRHVASRTLVGLGTVFVACSTVLLEQNEMAWSEPMFIVACLGFILALENVAREQGAGRWIVVAALAGSVAFMFRYAGLVLVPVGAASIVVSTWRGGWRRAVPRAVVFTVAAGVVPAIWMIRNWRASHTLLGTRYPSVDTPGATVLEFTSVVGSWFVPVATPRWLLLCAAVAVLAVCLAPVVIGRNRPDGSCQPTPRPWSLFPAVAFLVCYGAYMIVVQLTTAIDVLDSRLLSPLFVPLTVIFGVATQRLHTAFATTGRPGVRTAVLSVAVAYLVVQSVVYARHVQISATEGRWYATESWRALVAGSGVDSLPDDAVLYSNDPPGIWAVTGRQPISWSPASRAYRSSVHFELPQDFIDATGCRPTYLAWFDDSPASAYTPDQLRGVMHLTTVSSQPGSSLFHLAPLRGVTAAC